MPRHVALLRGVSPMNAKMPELKRCFEAALKDGLGRGFDTIVRSSKHLQGLVERDPFAEFKLPPNAKRVVTFLREPVDGKIALPPGKAA